ncbi:MAG: hypothetical protein MHM6MM_008885, partial [Cercozoa sp. M6MM]
MRCESDLLSDDVACNTMRPFIAIFGLLFVVLTCLFTMSMFDSNLRSLHPLARHDARSDLLRLLVRTALVVQAVLIQDLTVSLVTCGFASVLLIGVYGHRLPYFDEGMMQLRLASMSLFGWGTLFAIIQNNAKSGQGVMWAFVLSAPFVCFSAKRLVSWRLARLETAPMDAIGRAAEMLVKIRLIIRNCFKEEHGAD